jgi:predicted Zn-dependent protease
MSGPFHRFTVVLAGLTALGCGEIAAPVRGDLYEWRLVAPSIPGPGVDTLSFHWDRSDLPVKIWAQDVNNMPALVERAIQIWEAAFLYREFQATLVTDSTDADVIVLGGVPLSGLPSLRLRASAPGCAGVTDLDIDVESSQLRLPIRVSVEPTTVPDDPAIEPCLALTTIHELGHALGIFAHSPDPDDIMFSNPQVELPSTRDRQTAEAAYHTPPSLEAVGP